MNPEACSDPVWCWPRPTWRVMLALAGVFAGLAFWQGTVALLTLRGDGSRMPWIRPYIWEGSGYLAGYLLLYVPHVAVANAPSFRTGKARFLLLHGAAYVVMAAAVPPIFLGIRGLIWHLAGWGHYSYGLLAYRLPMEWLKLAFWYVIGVGLALFWRHRREAQRREAREAELRAQLQEARLAALAAQVDPHFLFNALHTVSSVMYEDLDTADRLLASLARMLRDGLEAGGPLWSFGREREHLEAYLDFALARFGDRLIVSVDLGEVPPMAAVPRFCLQRLVENALKHRDEARPLALAVGGRCTERRLALRVTDDGPGFSDPAQALSGNGTGLRNLRETLLLQFGDRADLELKNLESMGCCVCLALPLEELPRG